MAAKRRPAATEPGPAPRVTGKAVMTPINRVKPNTWNPNRMTEFQVESTREGMKADGWIAAYALLVWGKDDKGKRQNIIIDGEHRWRVASELGFTEGPMVFVDGLTKEQAIEWTIKFDAKRGRFDDVALADAIRLIGTDDAGLAFRLGIEDDTFKKLLEPSNVLPPEDFRDVSIDAHTDYRCPKCGYEWSGSSTTKKSE